MKIRPEVAVDEAQPQYSYAAQYYPGTTGVESATMLAVQPGEEISQTDPINLTLAPAQAISGSISMEGDSNVPMKNLRVMMNPLDQQAMFGPPPGAEVQNDGTFTINWVLPGRW